MTSATHRLRRSLVFALVAAAVAGCATKPPATPEELVRQRAEERWKLFMAGDLEKAYGYLTPASRAVLPFANYRALIGGATAWKAAKVHAVSCETSEKCIATIEVQHEPVLMRGRLGTITSYMEETWLLDQGQWWMLFNR